MKTRWGTTARVTAVFILLGGLAQWLTFHASSELLDGVVREREIDKVRTVGNLVQSLIRQQTRQARVAARVLADKEQLSRALSLQGEARLARLAAVLGEVYGERDFAIVEATDAQGVVLHRAHDTARWGDLDAAWGVAEALAGQAILTSSKSASGLVLRAIEPVRSGPAIVGSVSVGVTLNDANFKRLSSDVGADLLLLEHSGKTVAGSATADFQPDPSAIALAFQEKIPVFRFDPLAHNAAAYLPVTIVDEAWVIVTRIDSQSAFATQRKSVREAAWGALLILLGGAALATVTLWVA
ncbi:MAG: cache domain-containing protein, partial [Burkholderiaceae bacterium]